MAKGKEWAFLRGRLPELSLDPKYDEVVAVLRARYEKKHITEIVREWNRYTERKKKLARELKEVNADLVALEHLVRGHLERNSMERIDCEGVTLTKSPEVNVKVVDPDKFMAFMEANYPEMISWKNGTPKKLVKSALRRPVPGQEPSPMPEGCDVSLWEAIKRKEADGYEAPEDDETEDDEEEDAA